MYLYRAPCRAYSINLDLDLDLDQLLFGDAVGSCVSPAVEQWCCFERLGGRFCCLRMVMMLMLYNIIWLVAKGVQKVGEGY